MLVLAVGLRNWSVLAAAMLAGAFSEAVAEQHERADLRRRHGGAWAAYRRQVRRWIPRWQPYVSTPATLYIDLGCVPCRELGAMFRRLRPTGLALADARNHPEPLTRVRYERDDGLRADGLAAVARAAEHVDAACALLGWVARLPVLSWVLARFADRLCFGPRLRSGARPGQNPPSGSNPQRADSRRLDSGRLDSGRADSGPGGRKNRWRTTPGGD
jgi:hypothetical protein